MTALAVSTTPATPPRCTPPGEPTVANDLLRAAEVLEEWDWCQGQARDGDAFCVMGAIAFVTGEDFMNGCILDGSPRFHAAADAFVRLEPRGADWNDEPGRTKAEVVARLREAAETV